MTMRLTLSRHLFVLLLLLYPILSNSQVRQPRFDLLTVNDGLPENYATCTMQDHQGYIWIGTQNGLVRYDGYEVKIYKFKTSASAAPSYLSIRSIFLDKQNNIWAGTYLGGLYKYNSASDAFEQFSHSENGKGKISTENTSFILQDNNGIIWSFSFIDEKFHLDRVEPTTKKIQSFYSFSKGKEMNVTAMRSRIVDSKNIPWVGTANGLFKLDVEKREFKEYVLGADTATAKPILMVYEAPSQPGILWLIQKAKKENILVRLNTSSNKATYFPLQDTLARVVFEDRRKRLWIGMTDGISLFDRNTNSLKAYKAKTKQAAKNAILGINDTNNGTLWIRSNNGLLYLPTEEGSTLMNYTNNENQNGSLPEERLLNTLIDRNGTSWFSTRFFGLLKLNQYRSKFQYISQTNTSTGYPGGYVVGIGLLKNGDFLVSTSDGLYRSDPKMTTFSKITLKNNKGEDITPLDITVDRQGEAWVSSFNGLINYNPLTRKIKIFKSDPKDPYSISSDLSTAVTEDHLGNLWVGTGTAGVCKLDRSTGKFKRFPFIVNNNTIRPTNGMLDDRRVLSILEDRDGVIWVGTNMGSLNRLDQKTGKFTSYLDNKKEFHCISDIFEDKKGRLWVGTYLWGLFLFDKKTGTTKRILKKDGLVFDGVLYIGEDSSGKIWISSMGGFSILDPDTFKITTLSKSHGLPDDLYFGKQKTGLNGDWIFGTKKGLIRFNPDDFTSNSIPPELVLQQLTYSNGNTDGTFVKLLHQDKEIQLPYDYNKLVFKYAGLHYVNPALNQYQYQLKGYDKTWIKAGTQRSATYTNLAPGTYTFRFKAANSDGVWSEKTAEVTVTITPPWWKTWWAYLLYIIGFALAIQTYIAYRSRALNKHNQELEEQVNARTRQLSEANEELIASQEEIVAQRDELAQTVTNLNTTQAQLIQAEKMASLGELTAGIAHEIQNPLNFVNNFSDLSMELIDEMKEEFDKGDTTEALAIAEDIKVNLEKINHHGKRADRIVKGMLQHSRAGSTTKEITNLNALADEYMRLAYHGLRAKDKSFNAELIIQLDPSLPQIEVLPQDISRVLLNLFTNAFYATHQRQKTGLANYKPAVELTTAFSDNSVTVSVKDNGTGIPSVVKDKILQPFFTTKPTGEGTGLGLSLSYDIIKAHGGRLDIESTEGEGSEFKIQLPINNK